MVINIIDKIFKYLKYLILTKLKLLINIQKYRSIHVGIIFSSKLIRDSLWGSLEKVTWPYI